MYHSTRGMFVHPDKTLSADISDLSGGGAKQVFGRIYADACDEGLTLVSHKTGQEVRMAVSRTVRDNEGAGSMEQHHSIGSTVAKDTLSIMCNGYIRLSIR